MHLLTNNLVFRVVIELIRGITVHLDWKGGDL